MRVVPTVRHVDRIFFKGGGSQSIKFVITYNFLYEYIHINRACNVCITICLLLLKCSNTLEYYLIFDNKFENIGEEVRIPWTPSLLTMYLP